MQCDAFDRQLDDVLDRRASPASDARIRQHVRTCERCARVLSAHGQLAEILQRLEMPDVEPEAVADRRSRVAVLPILAACLLLGVAGWWLRHGPNEIARAPSPVPGTLHDEAGRGLGGPARPSKSSFAAGPSSALAMHQPLFGLQLLSQADWSATFSPVSNFLEVPRLQTEWITVVTNEMAPVQRSMTSAVRLLRRTLASSEAHEGAIDG